VSQGLTSFAGVENRWEVVAVVNGVRFVNDTSATAPVAVAAGLEALGEVRAHVIAGGADKQSDLVPLAETLAHRATTVTLLDGTATPRLREQLIERGVTLLGVHRSMESAMAAACSAAQPGDTVILSPGCASFGLFRDEFDRGAQFRAIAQAIEASWRTA
jgi:UDP-N-acetylmuramoylalanine--D-glutamate ligase